MKNVLCIVKNGKVFIRVSIAHKIGGRRVHANEVELLPLERDKGEPRGPITPSVHGALWCWRLVLGREGHGRSFGVFYLLQIISLFTSYHAAIQGNHER